MPFIRHPSASRIATIFAAIWMVLLATLASAQPTTGTIEGRVLNTRNGEYLEKARITVVDTSLETFTDATGQFRLSNVPAGDTRVRVFHTGLTPQTVAVRVTAGQTTTRDFELASEDRRAAAPGATVKLDQFVVSTSKEMDGAALAINEQRFASNMVNVLAADEFGHVAEGNVGEFLKFIPGISIDYGGGDARTISLGGAPSNNVPVTIGGFGLSSAASSGTSRTVELEQVSINNLSRIEVYHSPTPESPGSALAGGVNLVPRGAFERSRPQLNFSTYVMMRDAEKSLRKTPGPIRDETYKIHPGFDFSWVVPVNKRFGFTLSGGHSSQYTMQDYMANTWRGAGNATSAPAANGTPGALPDTTPDQPYLTNFSVRDGTKLTSRDSVGTTVDFKLSANDMISLGFQYAYFGAEFNNRTLSFGISRVLPGHFSPFVTNGDRGQGTITVSNGSREKTGTTYMPTLVWRHNGPIWKADAGVAYSHSTNHYRDIDKGYFNSAATQRTGVTISFRDIFYLRPREIEVTDGTTFQPVNPYVLDSYVLNSANSDFRESTDVQRTARASLARNFSPWGAPLAVKVGAEVRESIRDIRGGTSTYTFVGRDGVRTTTPTTAGSDDGAAIILDEIFSQRTAPYGFPKVQYVSNFKYWELYSAHPNYFTRDLNTEYRNAVTLSKFASEVLSSAYLRGDLALFNGRLKLVGGVRAEQTNVAAQGFLSDPTANYRRDANGDVIPQRDANGNIIFTGTGVNRIPAPTLIEPTTINGVSNALAVSRLTYIDRGQRTRKEYLRFFPSLNASYNLAENLIARGSYYYSVGRPDFAQYSGGLTLPDTELPPNSSSNRISVNNAGIKAWSAKTTKIRFEYYFQRVGQISVSGFRRDYRNLFGSVVFDATPEFLALYSLDPEVYDPYAVSTNYNVPGTVRMTGLEFDYKQALTFLPPWARGVQVFANATAIRTTGDSTASFTGYQPRVYNWGVSLTRERYNLRLNWNYRGVRRGSAIAASPRSIEPGTFNWISKRLYIDLSGEVKISRRFFLFGSMRNLGDATEDTERRGPNTPPHAQFLSREDFGSLWTFGIRGAF
ncbi:MAG: carboxypeptidase regulatory-like domain-containing protein [Verrucomicrobia bacterium]|nr:carboxypeptidase regulatory-like domain-containing protein [Verrucomicrobiota bacterium]